jgi:putative DNA primase/helicase
MFDDDAPLPDDLLCDCADEPETDIGNGKRLRRRFGDLAIAYDDAAWKAIAVAHIGWHVFDGSRWKEDEDGSLIRPLAHHTAEQIREEPRVIIATAYEREILAAGEVAQAAYDAISEPESGFTDDQKAERRGLQYQIAEAARTKAMIADRKKSRGRHAKSTAGSSKLNNMMAEAQPYMARKVQDLNVNRLCVNCGNGTIDFIQEKNEEPDPDGNDRFTWRAQLRQHRQSDMITKMSRASWTPGKLPPAPEFTKFLQTVQPDPEIRKFLQVFAGYCLTGLTVEQVMLFFYGAGRNGKSTIVDLLCYILDDYAVTLSIDSFSGDSKRGGSEATPDLARLPGARLVAASEPEANVKLKDALIKTLTGGEKIPVRRLHKDFFEVDPHFKIILSGNHKPRIDDDSDGIWRRVILVPWLVQIPKEDVDRALPQKLRKEADAIFAWMVEGAIHYLNYGLDIPKAVRAASDEYRQESDAIGTFIRMACAVTGDQQDQEKPFDLFVAFEKFADAEGVFKFNRSTFEKRFAKAADRAFEASDGTMKHFQRTRSNGATSYRGIRIRAEWLPGHGSSEGGA